MPLWTAACAASHTSHINMCFCTPLAPVCIRSEAAAREELAGRLEVASNDNAQLRRERKRLDEKLAHVHG